MCYLFNTKIYVNHNEKVIVLKINHNLKLSLNQVNLLNLFLHSSFTFKSTKKLTINVLLKIYKYMPGALM